MKPTQAQIEAGEYDLRCTNGHDRCYMGTSDDCPYCERVALTAAAEAGKPNPVLFLTKQLADKQRELNDVIERCAQVVAGEIYKEHYRKWPSISIVGNRANDDEITMHCDRLAAAIRAMKDKP